MSQIRMVFMLAVLVACAHSRPPADGKGESAIAHFNPELILPYSFDLERSRPSKSAFLAIYEKAPFQLLYLASHHLSVRDSPDLREHPTMKTIAKTIRELEPAVILIEGVPSGDELSPAWYLEHAKSCDRKNFVSCSEAAYAALLADQDKIPFMSGEPSDLTVKQRLIEAGYSEEDVIAFYLARMLPQHFRQDPDFGRSEKALRAAIESDLKGTRRELQTRSGFGYTEFLTWLRKRARVRVSDFSSADECAPVSTGTPLQRISSQVDVIRNRTLLKRMESLLNQYQKVLVIYGSGHFLSQRPALDSELGSPKIGVPFQ